MLIYGKKHFAIEGIMRGVVIFLFSCDDLSVPIDLCYLSFTRDLYVKAETSVTETRHWPLNGTETPRPTFFIYLR